GRHQDGRRVRLADRLLQLGQFHEATPLLRRGLSLGCRPDPPLSRLPMRRRVCDGTNLFYPKGAREGNRSAGPPVSTGLAFPSLYGLALSPVIPRSRGLAVW